MFQNFIKKVTLTFQTPQGQSDPYQQVRNPFAQGHIQYEEQDSLQNDSADHNDDSEQTHSQRAGASALSHTNKYLEWSPETDIYQEVPKNYESPMDKQSNMTFQQYLEQNQAQSLIHQLVEKYQKTKLGSNQIMVKQKLTSLREEVLDIIASLEHKEDILMNLDPIYSKEGQFFGVLRLETQNLTLPLDTLQLTEKCEELEQLQKVVAFQLSFNVMKRSEEFVEGMSTIQDIEGDLGSIKTHTTSNKGSLDFLKQKIALNASKALVLKRKHQRLVVIRSITKNIFQKLLNQEKEVSRLLHKQEFYKAIQLSQKSLSEIASVQQQFNFKALDLVKTRFDLQMLAIRDRMSSRFQQLCIKFDDQLYEKIIQGHQCNIFEQNHRSNSELVSHLKDKFRTQSVTQMKRTLIKYASNSKQLAAIGINQNNTQIKTGSLCKTLDRNYYVLALSDLYRTLSNLMYNHHLMTRHHLHKSTQLDLQGQKQNSDEYQMNDELRDALVSDRRDYWLFIQEKMVQLYQSTEQMFLDLSARELFDLLSLSNTFIEIGQEYAGGDDQLLSYLSGELTQKYVNKFKDQQMANLKNMLEREEWSRLPLPDNFQIQEIISPLQDFPKGFDQQLSLFISQKTAGGTPEKQNTGSHSDSNRAYSSKPKNLFAQFAISNPFDKVQLVSTLKDVNETSQALAVKTMHENHSSPKKLLEDDLSIDSGESSFDEDMDIGEDEEVKAATINDNYAGFANQEGASKSLTAYQQQVSINLNKEIVISQSSLNIVKGCLAKYIELMVVCRHTAFDLLISLTQACELFSFTVFHTFAQSQAFSRLFDDSFLDIACSIKGKAEDPSKYNDLHELFIFQNRYKNLRNHMVRVKNYVENNLSERDSAQQPLSPQIASNQALMVLLKFLPKAAMLQILEEDALDSQEKERIYKSTVAVESVLYMFNSLEHLKPFIKNMLNTQQQSFLIQFFNNYKTTIEEIKHFIYYHNVPTLAPLDQTITNIQFINWNIKQKKMDISTYVDKLLTTLEDMKSNLQALGGKESNIPQATVKTYIQVFSDYISDELIDSMSKIKKCSDFGRESLLVDIHYLRATIEGQIQTPLSCFDRAESYIQAYSKQREDLLSFIKTSDLSFTYNQTKALLQIAPSVQTNIKNSEKKEFLQNVDIFYKDYFSTFMITKSSHTY